MQWRPLKSERWKSSKRRTAKQKNQLANLHAKHHPNDENIPPPQELPTTPSNSSHTGGVDALANQLDVLKDRAITYERKYRNERKRNARKEMALMSLKNQYSSLSTEHKDYQDQLQHLHSHHGKLTKQNHALVMRVRRAIAAKKLANDKAKEASMEEPTFNFKEDGIITDASRSMVRDLVAKLDVPVASVNGAVNVVASALGVRVEGCASSRSIRRIIGEAGVAAEVQLVDEIRQAEGVTLSGDGTTHKNVNYQSHHITYALPGSQPVTRFAGALHEVNHTSETQLYGWQSRISSLYASFNDIKSCQNKADPRTFTAKVKGMLTDHAEDQKKLARCVEDWKHLSERELRGEQALSVLPPSELFPHLTVMMDNLMVAAGGPAGWDTLPVEKKKVLGDEALRQLRINVGEIAFGQLSDAEKNAVDFFVWAGCCMHKELNAMKGGNARIRAWWGQNAIEGPVLLMNKDNTAAAAAASDNSKVKDRAVNVSAGGAQKVLDLAGAIFRHKDSKKGQHDSLRYHMENVLGFKVQWPDTSNTRYHSHGDAACEFLVHEPLYVAYLEQIRLKKDSRTLTNIEENVLRGFSCPKTKEEIVCFAAYNQCITHPYLRTVRNNESNILDLGLVHTSLIAHIQKLRNDVDLVVGPSATYKTATMDGTPFTRPEAVYVIQRISSDTVTYPHIRRLLASFLDGAMETWIRFSREFASGGKIDGATATQRRSGFMKTTNDDNEGALGTVRTSLRRAPSMSLSHFNSRLMYKKNNTSSYVSKFLGPEEQKRLRKKARENDRRGDERVRREAQAEYDKQLAHKNKELDVRKKERKEAILAKLESVSPRTTPEAIESMKVAEINLQLRWHRQFDSQVPPSKDMPKLKAEKVLVLKSAVERYLRGEAVPGESANKAEASIGRVGDNGDSEEELY